MTSHRDSYINIPKYSPTRGTQEQKRFSYDMPEFKIMYCGDCHIKVSTSNGLCPCCQRKLAADSTKGVDQK